MRRKNRIQKAKEARRSRPKRFFAGEEIEDAEADDLALAEDTADLECKCNRGEVPLVSYIGEILPSCK